IADAAHDAVVAGNGHGSAATGSAGHGPAAPPTPRLVEVSAQQPDLGEDHAVSGALLVASAGLRTARELIAIAEACRDAGLRLAVVAGARPAGTAKGRPAERPDEAVDHQLVGASRRPIAGTRSGCSTGNGWWRGFAVVGGCGCRWPRSGC